MIGGLAVNAYVEPVVSLDVDIVVAVHDIDAVTNAARRNELKVEQIVHRMGSGQLQWPDISGHGD